YISFQQPTIYPLFKTRYFQTSLLKWSGDTTPDYETYFKNYWKGKLGDEVAFDKALQLGVIENAATTATGGSTGGDVAAAAAAIASYKKGGKNEIALYQKSSIGTGKQAGNPWLQELP